MEKHRFHDEFTLAEAAENMGHEAMALGLIPSFVVRHFPDSRQFYIPNEVNSVPLTPEQAYMRFKHMLEQANQPQPT